MKNTKEKRRVENPNRTSNARSLNKKRSDHYDIESHDIENGYDDYKEWEDDNYEEVYGDKRGRSRGWEGISKDRDDYKPQTINANYGYGDYHDLRPDLRQQSNPYTEYNAENYRRSGRHKFQPWGSGYHEGPFRGKGPKGYKRLDDRILDDINDLLTENPMLDASAIEVKIDQGDVTLLGSVPDKKGKRLAEDLSDSVSGVTNVENRLRIK